MTHAPPSTRWTPRQIISGVLFLVLLALAVWALVPKGTALGRASQGQLERVCEREAGLVTPGSMRTASAQQASGGWLLQGGAQVAGKPVQWSCAVTGTTVERARATVTVH